MYNFVYKSVRKWSQPCIRCKKRTICIGEIFLQVKTVLTLLAIVCKTTMTELLIVGFGDLYVCICMHILLCHLKLFCREPFNSSKVLHKVMKHFVHTAMWRYMNILLMHTFLSLWNYKTVACVWVCLNIAHLPY